MRRNLNSTTKRWEQELCFAFHSFSLLLVTRSLVNKWPQQRILCFFRLFLHFQNIIVALLSSTPSNSVNNWRLSVPVFFLPQYFFSPAQGNYQCSSEMKICKTCQLKPNQPTNQDHKPHSISWYPTHLVRQEKESHPRSYRKTVKSIAVGICIN